jgi:single-strand DNA-binding protein
MIAAGRLDSQSGLRKKPRHAAIVPGMRKSAQLGYHPSFQTSKAGTAMAGSVNKVILVGNLGRDPEVRHTQDGTPIVNLSVATSESWRDRTSGERKERTEWHRVVIFNEKIGEVAQKYLRKGSKVYLEGQLQTRKYTDPSGVEKYSTEVVLQRFRGELTMLDTRGGEGGGPEEFGGPSERTRVAPAPTGGKLADMDDEIPF